MVGRRVLLRVEKGAGQARARSSFRSTTSWSRTPRRHHGRRASPSTSAPARSSASPASPATASPNCSRRSRHAQGGSGTSAQRQADRRHRHADPRRLRDRGLAHVPEDRHHVGLVLPSRNARIPSSAITTIRNTARAGLPRHRRDHPPRRAEEEDREIRHPPAQPALKTANFSGGNQQKIVLAREMEQRPRRADRRPADARRRCRRHRVHPQAASSRCATRARPSCSSRSSSTRSARSSDRILVMFDGRIVGERDPATRPKANWAC
jgi:hypothetical protein